jgi:DNA-binding CsgD family transcriptional regulator
MDKSTQEWLDSLSPSERTRLRSAARLLAEWILDQELKKSTSGELAATHKEVTGDTPGKDNKRSLKRAKAGDIADTKRVRRDVVTGGDMPRWEYRVVSRKQLLKNQATLNDLGEAGWELVAINSGEEEWVFKRPKESELSERSSEKEKQSVTLPKVTDRFELLSDNEKQLLKLIAEARSNKEIARIMKVSAKKVEQNRSSLMSKLEVHDMASLVRSAMKHDLIALDEEK